MQKIRGYYNITELLEAPFNHDEIKREYQNGERGRERPKLTSLATSSASFDDLA